MFFFPPEIFSLHPSEKLLFFKCQETKEQYGKIISLPVEGKYGNGTVQKKAERIKRRNSSPDQTHK